MKGDSNLTAAAVGFLFATSGAARATHGPWYNGRSPDATIVFFPPSLPPSILPSLSEPRGNFRYTGEKSLTPAVGVETPMESPL